jgi:hypothetical protein
MAASIALFLIHGRLRDVPVCCTGMLLLNVFPFMVGGQFSNSKRSAANARSHKVMTGPS